MKKNVVIIVLAIISVVSIVVAVHAADKAKELMADSINYHIMEKNVREVGLHLNDVLTDTGVGEDLLWKGAKSICNDEICVHVDYDGDMFVTEFYK